MQKTKYQIISQNDSKKLTQFLCKEGQLLLPMVELITQAEMAIDELIGVTGRAAIEAVLTLSAQEIAGTKHPGKKARDITWYGQQSTTIPLSNRKLRVDKPRLRYKGKGANKEVENRSCQALARWANGSSLDSVSLVIDRETYASDHGLSAIVDIGSCP